MANRDEMPEVVEQFDDRNERMERLFDLIRHEIRIRREVRDTCPEAGQPSNIVVTITRHGVEASYIV